MGLEEVLNWNDDDRQAAFRASALKRVKLDMLRRNALIAAGSYLRHHRHDPLRKTIERIASDAGEPPLVRDTARQVLAQITKQTEGHTGFDPDSVM